jgi:hypothetical protein
VSQINTNCRTQLCVTVMHFSRPSGGSAHRTVPCRTQTNRSKLGKKQCKGERKKEAKIKQTQKKVKTEIRNLVVVKKMSVDPRLV